MTVEPEYRLTITAVIEQVETACAFVGKIARRTELTNDDIHQCYLSVEEICTNIIEHGYKRQGDNAVIDIVCRITSERLSITIIDDAPPFNPLNHLDPDPAAPLTEREGGGWGIFFVKKYMDNIQYGHENNRNRLTLEKYII